MKCLHCGEDKTKGKWEKRLILRPYIKFKLWVCDECLKKLAKANKRRKKMKPKGLKDEIGTIICEHCEDLDKCDVFECNYVKKLEKALYNLMLNQKG